MNYYICIINGSLDELYKLVVHYGWGGEEDV